MIYDSLAETMLFYVVVLASILCCLHLLRIVLMDLPEMIRDWKTICTKAHWRRTDD
jgi:hypothetical protein